MKNGKLFVVLALLCNFGCSPSSKTKSTSTSTPRSVVAGIPRKSDTPIVDVRPSPIQTVEDTNSIRKEEDEAQKAIDRNRQDELRHHKVEMLASFAKEEDIYKLAKLEFQATRKLDFAWSLPKGSIDERLKGNTKEADRLAQLANEDCQAILKAFPGTLAAKDAKALMESQIPPKRPLPIDPDDIKAFPSIRYANLQRSVDLAFIENWDAPIQQIPATVIDKGAMMYVPYQSYRAGAYEFNVYGDPNNPACIEIGLNKTLLENVDARKHCLSFMALLFNDASDRCLIKYLNINKDLQKRGSLTFEVTPENAEDAYGCWWISVYDVSALDKSRASPKELQAITVPNQSSQSAGNAGSGAIQGPVVQSRPGTAVYVHGYMRKNGTYVQPYTRSAPGTGNGRK